LPADLLVTGLLLLLLLAGSAFFSGSETALFSLRETELEEMSRARSPRARRAVSLVRRPYRTLVTLLLSNMVVNVIISVLITSFCLRTFGAVGLGVAIPAASVLLVLFGEIIPKSLGLRQGRSFAELAAPVIHVVSVMLGPIRDVLERLAEGASGEPQSPPLDREELATLVEVAQEDGDLTPFEARVLKRILLFATVTAGRFMTPRVDMVAVDVASTPDEIASVFDESGRSRVAVVEGDRDHVVGVLLLKDFLTHEGDRTQMDVADLMRRPLFVPESLPAPSLFRQFHAHRLHIAVVVGEHGGVEGIVTLEDLLEEIVGDIHDEGDEPEVGVERLADGTWRADAAMELDDLGDALGIDLDTGKDAVTLSGLLQESLGRIPRAGDRVTHGELEFRVLSALPTRPRVVQVRRKNAGD
jgi:putative hemolysin